MHINPYSIGPSFSGVFILILGYYVLSRNFRNPLNQSFCFSYLMVGIWLSFYSILYNFDNQDPNIQNYYKIAYCVINFIAIAFFTHINLLLNLKWTKIWNILNYVYGFIVSILILKTNLIVSGLHNYYFGLYPKAGPLHPFFLIYFISLILIQIKFLVDFIKNHPNDKQKVSQIKYVLIGYTMMCLASFDFLPNYGFEFYPPGFIFSLIFALLVSYAIVKHELLDIKIVIRKSVIYSFLIALITISYLLIVLFFEKVTKNILGYTSPNLSIFTAFIVGIFVIPLKGWLQNILDNAFFKGTAIEIAEENASLRHAVTQTEKLRAVATLASGLAHEIRNPLTTIATFAEYLPSKKDDPEFLAKCHQTLIHETKRVNDLLSELLVFAKPSPPTFQVINPNKLIEDILLLSSHQCEQNNIQIKKNLTTNLNIQADPNQLKQALLNIIFNAVDAMPNGGTLTIETSLKDAYCVISIHDTGPGINPKDLKQIFDPFFTKKEKGTGLGLAITHGIIEQHTGKIVVKSDIRFGTKFIIYLSAEKIQ